VQQFVKTKIVINKWRTKRCSVGLELKTLDNFHKHKKAKV
jgi:hypothetical protein